VEHLVLVSVSTPINSIFPGYSWNEEPEVTEEEIEDIVEEIREVPRLAVIREEPDDEASRDGITARAKVPSWDEIMFGIKPDDK